MSLTLMCGRLSEENVCFYNKDQLWQQLDIFTLEQLYCIFLNVNRLVKLNQRKRYYRG